jgi:hypothetical protein
VESSVKYHSYLVRILTDARETGIGTVLGGQFGWGGLLQRVTEESKGTLNAVGNRA